MEKQYTIRPLKWEVTKCPTMEAYTANVPMGKYRVERYREEFNENKPWQPWKLMYCFDEYYDEGEINCSSAADGKRKAYEDWKARILPALKEV